MAFGEFLECFDEDIIVTLKVYVDESVDVGGHATGKIVPVVSGYIAPTDNWKRFVVCWKSALETHKARSFHFREFATAKEYGKKDSQYYGWSKKKRDVFLYDMATEAGLFAIPLGVMTDAEDDKRNGLNPYEEVIKRFFKEISEIAKTNWPANQSKILILWDKGACPEWSVPMIKIHSEFADLPDSRIGSLLLGDDKIVLPLQAADMLSYAARQTGERYLLDFTIQKVRLLDLLLHKNRHDSYGRYFPETEWRPLVAALRNLKDRQKDGKFYVTEELIDRYDFKKREFV